MSGFFDVYSIIFLIIAVVIFMRLGSVLGRRTGNEPSPYEHAREAAGRRAQRQCRGAAAARPRRRRHGRGARPETARALTRRAGTPLHDGLVAIAKAAPDFDPEHFIAGAKAAYEMIVTAFAQGDRATLKNLLAADVYDGFVGAIAEREKKEQKAELTFVGIEEVKMTARRARRTASRASRSASWPS